ncbi:hypothetical protein JOF55_000678 [Haloactinomyces albus]|uniref:Uncharacterized protein n=1 Tax=Haloactinomyces albus TaxID=1352928 RepID=A0AAE3Z8W2_9ACTN|nr:hypothetical protein [Haloactinomyces albus]
MEAGTGLCPQCGSDAHTSRTGKKQSRYRAFAYPRSRRASYSPGVHRFNSRRVSGPKIGDDAAHTVALTSVFHKRLRKQELSGSRRPTAGASKRTAPRQVTTILGCGPSARAIGSPCRHRERGHSRQERQHSHHRGTTPFQHVPESTRVLRPRKRKHSWAGIPRLARRLISFQLRTPRAEHVGAWRCPRTPAKAKSGANPVLCRNCDAPPGRWW